MILTVSTFKQGGAELEEGLRHVTEEVVPSISGSPGLVAGYWVVDRENGERLSVMVWESGDAMAEAMPKVMALIKAKREQAGRSEPQKSPDSSQRFEVVASV